MSKKDTTKGSGKTRLDEKGRKAAVAEAVKAGATSAGAVRRYLNEKNIACDVKWIAPLMPAGAATPKTTAASSGTSQPKAEAPRNEAGLTAAQQAKADLVVALKAEGKAIKDWKAGGEKGPRPATPETDRANAALEAKRAKATEKSAAAAKAVEDQKAKVADKAAAKKAPAAGRPPVNRTTVTPRPKAGTSKRASAAAKASAAPTQPAPLASATVKPEHVVDAHPVARAS